MKKVKRGLTIPNISVETPISRSAELSWKSLVAQSVKLRPDWSKESAKEKECWLEVVVLEQRSSSHRVNWREVERSASCHARSYLGRNSL